MFVKKQFIKLKKEIVLLISQPPNLIHLGKDHHHLIKVIF